MGLAGVAIGATVNATAIIAAGHLTAGRGLSAGEYQGADGHEDCGRNAIRKARRRPGAGRDYPQQSPSSWVRQFAMIAVALGVLTCDRPCD